MPAIITLIIAGVISLIGQFVPVFKPLYDMSFFTGTIIAFILYSLIAKKPTANPVDKMNKSNIKLIFQLGRKKQ